jgi:pimeloyl-ACP methyl ester carboxylesterase
MQPQFSRITTNGVALHVAEAGPKDGPLLILLHGFPEFWYGWRHQIGPLARAGFHVVVPDQRGYNLSDKPKGVEAYRLDELAKDVIGLADHFGAGRFFLAGHDWGSIAGWWTAQNFPDRVRRFVAVNAGHPAVWKTLMRDDPEQRGKSRYVKFLQVPWLPEAMMRARNFKALADAVSATAQSGLVTDEDLARYRQAWARKGALTAAVNWYRAINKTEFKPQGDYRIHPPVLMVWGMNDIYGSPALADESLLLCDVGKLLRFDNATHWVLRDEADAVTREMLAFFEA